MYDSSSAFTHDDFQSSIEDHYDSTAAFNAVTLPDAVAIGDNILASEHITQHHSVNILVTTICAKSSAEADVQDLNPHRETLEDTISYGESGNVNVAPEDILVHRIEPKNSDSQKTAEPDTVISQGDMIETKDLGHGINQDPVCAPTLHERPVKDAASSGEAASGAILMTCKAAQDTQSDAKNTGNKPVKAAFEGENIASDAICPSTPRRNTCHPMRPSREIHPSRRGIYETWIHFNEYPFLENRDESTVPDVPVSQIMTQLQDLSVLTATGHTIQSIHDMLIA